VVDRGVVHQNVEAAERGRACAMVATAAVGSVRSARMGMHPWPSDSTWDRRDRASASLVR